MGYSWQRTVSVPTGTQNSTAFAMANLQPGQTHRRVTLTQDLVWVNTAGTLGEQLGFQVNYGLIYGPSAATPPDDPFLSPNPAAGDRWLWWDTVIFHYEVASSGTTIYYRNTLPSQYIDTRTNYKNTTAATKYLWWVITADTAAPAGRLFSLAAATTLIHAP